MGLLLKDISVDPFSASTRNSTVASEQLTSMVTAKLAQQQYMTVNPGSTHALQGKVVVSKFQVENSQEDRYKIKKVNGKPKLVKDGKNCVVEKKSSINGSYSIVSRNSSKVIRGDNFSVSIQDKGADESCGGARAELDTDEELIQQAMDEISRQIVRYISPHQMTETVKFMTARSGDNKLGIGFFQDGLVEEAVNIWRQVSIDGPKPGMRAAAFYNMGLAHESVSNLQDAHKSYQQAARLDPREKQFRRSLSRIVRQQKNRNKL